MYLERPRRLMPLLILGLATCLCTPLMGCDENKPQPIAEPAVDVEPEPDLRPELAPSIKVKVKFKGGQRYARDLSNALNLSRVELCRELGQYDCVDLVHNITLGGVEPYQMGIHDPLPVAPVTAPIAVDRVALQACDRRATMDFEEPAEAVLFAELAGGNSDDEAYREAITRLTRRLLLRDPEVFEVEALLDFRAEVAEEVEEAQAPEAWASMACFMIATSKEALFY